MAQYERSTFVLDRPAILRMFQATGQVGRWGYKLSEEIALEARELLIPHSRTFRLADSIVNGSSNAGGNKVNISVSAGTDHALVFIKGAHPHIIHTDHFMRFTAESSWTSPITGKTKGPGKARAHTVHHPGWRGYNFLDDAKRAVLARRGL